MKEDTKVVRAGRHPEKHLGVVNPPVFHASTVLVRTLDELENMSRRADPTVVYGRRGTPTTYAFEEAVCVLEGGDHCFSYGSGVAAISAAMLAFATTGAHFLVADSVYTPTRRLCDTLLKRWGVETTYYDPLIGAGIERLFRPNTKMVFCESPGSLTFEVQDIPAIAKVAHAMGAVVLLDNTWASPLYFKPFNHGVDVSIQSATKYIGGHSDAMLGTVTVTRAVLEPVREATHALGYCLGPDDAYLGQRGLRTLAVRLRQHWQSGLKIARWLQARPEVERVIHPALPGDSGYDLWKRDFEGASGLFGFLLKPCSRAALAAMVNGFDLFGMGASWGGYESLCMPTHPERSRTATKWQVAGHTMRIHVGLEDADDLIADLERAFARLNEVERRRKGAAA
jgi:cystathionine beta-lyase